MLLSSCNDQYDAGTFGYDLEKLRSIEGLEVLQSENAMIAVSGIYQGRVFTSTAKGIHGKSYGWINWDLIEKDEAASTMAYLGGESRMWFAPEWGPFALFFEPGAEQKDEHRRAPHDLHNC